MAGMGVCTRPHIDSNVNVQEGMKIIQHNSTVNNREQPLQQRPKIQIELKQDRTYISTLIRTQAWPGAPDQLVPGRCYTKS